MHRRPFPLDLPGVEVVKGDLTTAEDCARAVAGMDMAIFAAAVVVGAAAHAKDPSLPVTTNLIMSARFLEAAAKARLERVLLLSSTTTYPAVDRQVREDEWDQPVAPVYQGVGNMKRYVETLASFYHDKFGLKIAIIRPVPCYGPWDNFDPMTSHVIPALIRKAVEGQDPLEVWGTGKDVRDFVYASDVARAGLLVLERQPLCDAFNVASGRAVSTGDLAGVILKLAGRPGAHIVFNTAMPSAIPVRIVDSSKIERVLGFRSRVPLEEGLAATIEWFRKSVT